MWPFAYLLILSHDEVTWQVKGCIIRAEKVLIVGIADILIIAGIVIVLGFVLSFVLRLGFFLLLLTLMAFFLFLLFTGNLKNFLDIFHASAFSGIVSLLK